MATQVQNRRGTTAEHSTFTGAVGEVTIDTDKDTVVVHDGATAGGRPLLREDQSNLPTSAPTTGIYNNSGALALSTNGTGRLFVDASGRIGTGAVLNAKLDIATTSGTLFRCENSGIAQLNIGSNGNSTNFYDADTQVFRSGAGAERARLNSTGLGVGTSSPASILHVNQDVSSGSYQSRITLENADQRTIIGSYWRAGVGQYSVIQATNEAETTPNALALNPSGGSVGIGTSSPSRLLHVQSANGTPSQIQLGQSSQRDFYVGLPASSPDFEIFDASAGASRLRITAVGNVGIGTTSPSALLHLNATAPALLISRSSAAGTPSATGLQLSIDGTTYGKIYATASGGIGFAGSSSDYGTFDTSGRLLVGTSSARSFYSTSVGSTIQQEGTTNATRATSMVFGSNDAAEPIFILAKHRGSVGQTTAVANADALGRLSFHGYDGTNPIEAAFISAQVDGTPGANDMPGRIVLATTADGASSPTERMRITQAGYSKHSNSGSYTSTTGSYHEFYQTANDYTVFQRATFGSYTGGGNIVAVDRAANSAYYFFIGSSNYASGADTEFSLRGDGNAFADGSWTGGGADYAEYFEWQDGNPDAEDRRGYPVALVGNKIKIAEDGDAIIGIVSAAPVVLGDAAWNHWSGKYLKDEFGAYLLDENGDRQLNPDYDPTQPYVPREDRPEWSPIGLMGKLRLRKGQPVAANWLKLRDISATVEEWLVR